MYCPHEIIVNWRWLYIQLETKRDYVSQPVPLQERLNPLRYSISLGPRRRVKGTASMRHLIEIKSRHQRESRLS